LTKTTNNITKIAVNL